MIGAGMTEPEKLQWGRAWLSWHLGQLAMSRDFLGCGRALFALYVMLGRDCLTFELAQQNLSECWGGSKHEVPAPLEWLVECWEEGLKHPLADLVTMTACVGALYVLCVEGRLAKEEALDLAPVWQRAQQLSITAPGGSA